MTLKPKEASLLKDLQAQEQLCIEKYKFCAEQAKDAELRELFGRIGNDEQTHYQSLSEVLSGTVPPVSSKKPAAASYEPRARYMGRGDCNEKKHDQFLCTDCITMEKYTSGAYDTSLFQFDSTGVRTLLNDIQTEEQNHAEMIYKYKTANGMV